VGLVHIFSFFVQVLPYLMIPFFLICHLVAGQVITRALGLISVLVSVHQIYHYSVKWHSAMLLWLMALFLIIFLWFRFISQHFLFIQSLNGLITNWDPNHTLIVFASKELQVWSVWHHGLDEVVHLKGLLADLHVFYYGMDRVRHCSFEKPFVQDFCGLSSPEHVEALADVPHVVASPEQRLAILIILVPREDLFFLPSLAGHEVGNPRSHCICHPDEDSGIVH